MEAPFTALDIIPWEKVLGLVATMLFLPSVAHCPDLVGFGTNTRVSKFDKGIREKNI
jgi:hypothetical protein